MRLLDVEIEIVKVNHLVSLEILVLQDQIQPLQDQSLVHKDQMQIPVVPDQVLVADKIADLDHQENHDNLEVI